MFGRRTQSFFSHNKIMSFLHCDVIRIGPHISFIQCLKLVPCFTRSIDVFLTVEPRETNLQVRRQSHRQRDQSVTPNQNMYSPNGRKGLQRCAALHQKPPVECFDVLQISTSSHLQPDCSRSKQKFHLLKRTGDTGEEHLSPGR